MSARSAMASAGAGRRRRGYRQLPRQCTPPVYPLLQMPRYPQGLSRGAVWLPDRPDGRAVSAAQLSEGDAGGEIDSRSEEHTSELQSLMRISYAVFCLKKKHKKYQTLK